MDCQVCFLPYNKSTRMPKTLVCGHTFCTECLTKIQDAAASSIMCPKDRKTSAVPEGGITELITNFTVLEMLSDDCLDCHEKTQDGQCLPEHCSKLLCSDCKASHLKEFSQELITELETMKKQMSKQQALCDDNTDLTKMIDQSQSAIAEINRVFDAEKEKMIKAIRGKQETDGNDYFEWQKNFNVCLAKGRSFLNKVTSEIRFGVDSLSGKYLSELKKQIMSEKEAIHAVELERSHFSSFDAGGVQQEFDQFIPSLYDLVMASHGATTRSPGATATESKQDVKQTGATTMTLGATATESKQDVKQTGATIMGLGATAETKQATLVPPAGSGAGKSSHSSGVATSPVTGTRTARIAEQTTQDGNQPAPVPNYNNVTLSQTYGRYGFGTGEFYRPWGVATSPVTGNIAISDHRNHRIHIVTSDLHPVRVFGSQGFQQKNFFCPTGVCFSSSGRLFIADQYNHCIHQVSEEGDHISTFGSEGKGEGQFDGPLGICWESGLLFICDRGNCRIQVMRESGEHMRSIESVEGRFYLYYPQHIAVSSHHNKLVVSDTKGNLHLFSPDGCHRKTIGASQRCYNLQEADGIAIDILGQIIVADPPSGCVIVLGDDEVISSIRLSAELIRDQFGKMKSHPQDVTVTHDGSIIVCDQEQHKIHKLTTGHH